LDSTSSGVSEETEGEFIQQLMKQFGSPFVDKIERMFQDFNVSKTSQEESYYFLLIINNFNFKDHFLEYLMSVKFFFFL
jgi:hypothetical protein